MSLARVGTSALRNLRPKAGGHKGPGFFSEGTNEPTGYLFGETPPPPGQKRKWESWEAPWCVPFPCLRRILGFAGLRGSQQPFPGSRCAIMQALIFTRDPLRGVIRFDTCLPCNGVHLISQP